MTKQRTDCLTLGRTQSKLSAEGKAVGQPPAGGSNVGLPGLGILVRDVLRPRVELLLCRLDAIAIAIALAHAVAALLRGLDAIEPTLVHGIPRSRRG